MAKRKGGLGADAFFDADQTKPAVTEPESTAQRAEPSIVKPEQEHAVQHAQPSKQAPIPAVRSRGRPAIPGRSPATFNLADSIQNSLDRAWFQLREMAPRKQRKSINKSQIVEAALIEMLEELNDQGRDSKLAYYILNQSQD